MSSDQLTDLTPASTPNLSASTSPDATRPVKPRRNWSLWIGGILVGFILLLAIFGPQLAPRDPREHNLIIQIDGEWLTPAYPAFTPGFPLGSDNLGRDLYSWLLWSVRPTLILVSVVATLRMILGVLIGVTAGWSDRLPGRLADILISGALAVPALIASLIVITAVGFRLGIWAFVVGLSVTGWAETAQMVRERTRTVKGEDSVEAARSLGASGAQILLLHILPHVMPMIWMLLAFEVSHTLVTTAGLGFLGYYLGGAVFTEVDDFVYQRISEMPELGQMLATAWLVLDEPWAMVAAGTVVFLIVLAFNLVGEGLQHRLTRKLGGARVLYLRAAGDVIPWLDDHISTPLGALLHNRVAQGALLILLVAAVVVGVSRGLLGPGVGSAVAPAEDGAAPTVVVTPTVHAQAPEGTTSAPVASAFDVPGDHIWANEDHDPWRARWAPFTGPLTTTVQWRWDGDSQLTGGPVIDREGMLYIAGRVEDEAGVLYALSPAGEPVWEVALSDEPVGSPALDAEGTIYVADRAGLTAVTSAGEIRWRADAPDGKPAVSSPMVFPNGTTVYKSLSGLVALASSGDLLWHTPMTDTRSTSVPHLSADGQTVFWNELGFELETGAPVTWTVPAISGNPDLTQVVVGADGERYWQRGAALVQDMTPVSEEEVPPFFDLRQVTWQGADAGVTPGGRPWLAARPSVGGMGLGFFWGDAQGELSSKIDIPGARNARVLAVDAQETAYICADAYQNGTPMCVAMGPDAVRPLWRLPLRRLGAIAGAALAPGRLYVATWDGHLLAVGDDATPSAAPTASGGAVDVETGVPIFGPQPLWSRPTVPGGHPWPMPRRDAYGTLWTDSVGPENVTEQWVAEQPGGFAGGPVVAADGTVYVGTVAGSLVAYDAQGALRWRAALPAPPVGAPAIGEDGTIYVTDQQANLFAFDPNGQQLWRYHASGAITETRHSSSGAVLSEEIVSLDGLGPAGAGPIVAPDGTLYYSMAIETYGHETNVFFRSEVMLAVSPAGAARLDPPLYIWSERRPARISADGHWVVWGDTIHAPTPTSQAAEVSIAPYAAYISGRLSENQNLALRAVVGADGRSYFVEKRTLASWYLTPHMLVFDRIFEWEPEESPGTAADGGATPDGLRWLLFRNGTFIWITADDAVHGPVRFPLESQLIGLDADATAYGCGSSLGRTPSCMAFSFPSAGAPVAPRWQVDLDEGEAVLGGALAPATLYITVNTDRVGRLYAFGD